MWVELAMATALQQGPAAFADLPHVTVRTYVVEGRGAKKVRESVDARRPTGSDGLGRDAATTWSYQIRSANTAAGVCRPETTEITYDFVVTLPELGENAFMSGEALQRWHAWADYLTAHERRRVESAITGFEALQASMRAAPDCAAMAQRRAEGLAAIAESGRAMDAAVAEQYRRNPRRLPTFP